MQVTSPKTLPWPPVRPLFGNVLWRRGKTPNLRGARTPHTPLGGLGLPVLLCTRAAFFLQTPVASCGAVPRADHQLPKPIGTWLGMWGCPHTALMLASLLSPCLTPGGSILQEDRDQFPNFLLFLGCPAAARRPPRTESSARPGPAASSSPDFDAVLINIYFFFKTRAELRPRGAGVWPCRSARPQRGYLRAAQMPCQGTGRGGD